MGHLFFSSFFLQFLLLGNYCLKKFLSEQEAHISVESLSYGAGVSVKNINRYLQDKKLCSTFSDLGLSFEKQNNIEIKA